MTCASLLLFQDLFSHPIVTKIVKSLVTEAQESMQGDGVRDLLSNIPRNVDPKPMIHVYIDLNLETLHTTGFFESETQQDLDLEGQENGKVKARSCIPSRGFQAHHSQTSYQDRPAKQNSCSIGFCSSSRSPTDVMCWS